MEWNHTSANSISYFPFSSSVRINGVEFHNWICYLLNVPTSRYVHIKGMMMWMLSFKGLLTVCAVYDYFSDP